MGKSFFLGSDAEIYTGSAAFASQIGATPTSFGVSSIQAASYATLNSLYASSYLAASNPETRTTAAVAAKNSARDILKISASNLAKIIDGTPTVTAAQKLGLGLSVRATPSPVPPPGTPGDFNVELQVDGSLVLTWKCHNPAGSVGTFYNVGRKIGSGEFVAMATVGSKKFTDSTIPAGTASVTYQITAGRTTGTGAPAQFNVNFGVGGAGEVTAAVVPPSAPRIAA